MKSKKQFIIIICLIAAVDACLIFLFVRFGVWNWFITVPLPESGVWHNETLHMDIDFDRFYDVGGDCVTVYSSDGKTKTKYNLGGLERGNSVEIHPIRDGYIIDTEVLLEGTYVYYDTNIFTITSDRNITYEFHRSDSAAYWKQ